MESNEIKLTEEQIREAQMLAEGKRPNNPEQNEEKLRNLAKIVKAIGIVMLVISIIVAIAMIGNYSSEMSVYEIEAKYHSHVAPPVPPTAQVIVTVLSGLLIMFANFVTSAFLNVFCDNAKNLREMNQK